MNKLVLTATGGFPLKLDDLLWMDGRIDAAAKGMYDAIQSHLLAYGTDFIVEGCTYAAPNITAGWIMFGSELMRVDAAAGTDDYFVRTVTFDARGSKTFKDTTVNNTYEKIRGVLSGASGSLNITTALRLEDKIIQLLATSAQQFVVGNIPNLPASKTTSGSFDDARIPNLAAGKTTSGIFDPARLPAASTSAIGAVEKATTAEAKAFTADKFLDGALLADVNGGLLTKIVDIGDWNMNVSAAGSATINVAHAVTDYLKIRRVTVVIRNDTDTTFRYPLTYPGASGVTPQGAVGHIAATNIDLRILSGGFFDGALFDATSYNRGFIIIDYLP